MGGSGRDDIGGWMDGWMDGRELLEFREMGMVGFMVLDRWRDGVTVRVIYVC